MKFHELTVTLLLQKQRRRKKRKGREGTKKGEGENINKRKVRSQAMECALAEAWSSFAPTLLLRFVVWKSEIT